MVLGSSSKSSSKRIARQTDIFIAWKDRDDITGKITYNQYDFSQYIISDLQDWILSMTEAEEKFANFFKKAYDKGADVSQMTYEQLDSWIDELEDIILEAKATVQGATTAKRERKAKLSAAEREKTSDHDSSISVSDAISSVNRRKDRMTKMDKLKDMYDKMVESGLMSQEDANTMLGTVKVDESKQSTMSFNKEKKEIVDTAKLASEAIEKAKEQVKPKEPTEAFNFDDLFKK